MVDVRIIQHFLVVNSHFYGNKKRRIKTLKPYRSLLANKKRLFLGVADVGRFLNIFGKIVFTSAFENGEPVLPLGTFGPVS